MLNVILFISGPSQIVVVQLALPHEVLGSSEESGRPLIEYLQVVKPQQARKLAVRRMKLQYLQINIEKMFKWSTKYITKKLVEKHIDIRKV